MQGIIDSHVHAYPGEVIDNPTLWAERRNETFWAAHVAGSRIQGWADCDRMLRDMDAAGVAVAVLQGWYWENQSTCDEENQWHSAWVKAHPDRFASLVSLQPKAGVAAIASLRKWLDAGFRGVGELHPWVQGWSLESDTWAEIARLCETADLPVCFHVTEPVGRLYAGRTDTPLDAYAAAAARCPKLKMVLAHWGGGMPFYLLNKWTRKDLVNVYYDTAASSLVYTKQVWNAVIRMTGKENVLFGTDYPLRIYPKVQSEPDFRLLLEEAREQLTPDAFAAVTCSNAARVYRLG
jgi:predicted TIM-barrel fold metal-dependent hydrolase